MESLCRVAFSKNISDKPQERFETGTKNRGAQKWYIWVSNYIPRKGPGPCRMTRSSYTRLLEVLHDAPVRSSEGVIMVPYAKGKGENILGFLVRKRLIFFSSQHKAGRVINLMFPNPNIKKPYLDLPLEGLLLIKEDRVSMSLCDATVLLEE